MSDRRSIMFLTFCLSVLFQVSCREKDDPAIEGEMVTIMMHMNSSRDEVRTMDVEKGTVPGHEPNWTVNYPKHVMTGWYRDPECTVPFDFFTDVIDGPLDVYMGWGPELLLTDKGKVARVTGKSQTGESALANPNRTDERWNLGGTDLGIIWEMANGEYGVFFGDSYGSDFRPCGGGPGGASDWRSNVLAFSQSTDFSRGLVFSDMYHEPLSPNRAAAVIIRENYLSFTYIPTAAISLDGNEYMHYMYWEVGDRSHDNKVYSSFVKSENNGRSWSMCNGKISFSHDSYFGMVAMATKPGDEYCYMMGARTGAGYRKSSARLARFRHSDILDKSQYEFWNSKDGMWIKGDESKAGDVLDGTVGEMSLMYFEQYDRWVAMYFDSAAYAICYRSAARVNGPWSEEHVLCRGTDWRYAQLYGSFIHPACAKKEWGSAPVYWTISQWQPYNVFLMKAEASLAK